MEETVKLQQIIDYLPSTVRVPCCRNTVLHLLVLTLQESWKQSVLHVTVNCIPHIHVSPRGLVFVFMLSVIYILC